MTLCDASSPGETGGVYHLPYIEAVEGKRHAYWTPGGVEWTRSDDHPEDPKCPECQPYAERNKMHTNTTGRSTDRPHGHARPTTPPTAVVGGMEEVDGLLRAMCYSCSWHRPADDAADAIRQAAGHIREDHPGAHGSINVQPLAGGRMPWQIPGITIGSIQHSLQRNFDGTDPVAADIIFSVLCASHAGGESLSAYEVTEALLRAGIGRIEQ